MNFIKSAILTVLVLTISAVTAFAQTRQPSTTDRKTVVVRGAESEKITKDLKDGERHEFLSENGLYSQFWVEAKSNKIDEAEVHDNSDDYHVILEGETTYIIGGKLVNPKELKNRPGEWRSEKVEGGERINVKKGDVLFVPRGTVHQRDTTGKSVKYQIIKIHAEKVEQRKPTTPKPTPTPTEKPKTEVQRTTLMQAAPQAMAGWEMLFRRIILPPGAGNNGEVHPGMQVVYVESGKMNLRILGGQMKLRRANAGEGEFETLTAPNEYEIRTGDTLHEPEACVHAPRNNSSEPLVILVASLIPKGAEPTVFLKEKN